MEPNYNYIRNDNYTLTSGVTANGRSFTLKIPAPITGVTANGRSFTLKTPAPITGVTANGRSFTLKTSSELKGIDPAELNKRSREEVSAPDDDYSHKKAKISSDELESQESEKESALPHQYVQGQITDEKQLHGVVQIFEKNGKLFYLGQAENGKAHGHGKTFNGDGSCLYHGGWSNGKRHGQGT